MKLFFVLVGCIAVLVNSNAQYQFSTGFGILASDNGNTFTDIPIMPQSTKVDVFLSGETPKQDFYKVRVLEVSGSDSYNELLSNLKIQAQQLGFDGIKIIGTTQYTTEDNSTKSVVTQGLINGLLGNKNAEYVVPTINGQRLSAIALKYKSNIDYIDKIVKHANIKLNDLDKTEYNLLFSLNGASLAVNKYADSHFYLTNISLFQFADFFTKHHATSSSDDLGYKMSTGKLETDSGNIKYKAYYSDDSLVEKVQIKMPTTPEYESIKLYEVSYNYKVNMIARRNISVGRRASLFFTDVYNYDNQNRRTGFTRYDAKTNKEVFTVSYEFFNTNDLPLAEKAVK